METGQEPSESQWETYNGQREYIIPILNRGRFQFSKDSIADYMAISGTKGRQNAPQIKFLVFQPRAAFVGVIIGIAVLITLALTVSKSWIVATIAMAYGFVAQLPGAYAVKMLRRVREAIGG